jgi:predicted nucleic acid-binding protein
VSAGLLDTSVIVSGIDHAEAGELPDEFAISVMTIGELHAGVLSARTGATRASRLQRLSDVQRDFPAMDIDVGIAQRFGELRASSGRRGVADLLIAATALHHEMTLVTRDERQARLLKGTILLGG